MTGEEPSSGENDSLSQKLRLGWAQVPYIPKTLRMVWDAAGGWTIAWASLLAVQGLLPVATVYITRAAVNALVAAVRAGGSRAAVMPVLAWAGAMGAVLILNEAMQNAAAYVRSAQAELVRDHIAGLIHRKSVEVDLGFYESADFYDRLHRARDEASYRPMALTDSLGNVTRNSITLVAMGAVLIPYGAWLPLLLVGGTLPALWVVLRHSLLDHTWRKRTTPDERRAWYYDSLLTSGEAAAEIRLWNLGGLFQDAFQTLRRRLRGERLAMARSLALAEVSASGIGLAATGVAMLRMIWLATRGLVTLGDVALFYQAFQQGTQLMRSLLENASQLYSSTLFLGNLFEFLQLPVTLTDPASPAAFPASPAVRVRFENITFRYVHGQRTALNDFSLEIPSAATVAVVGSNGAGKSTLVKLLCRFYDPEAGRITVDGIDLRQFRIAELRRAITVMFQSPVHFNATARDNIGYGDLELASDAGRVREATTDAGAGEIIERLAQKFDTLLGHGFADGSELSGGEWQRIALARAFLRPARLLVLDEPTSSMDPWAESAWLARFKELAHGRTVLIITHRFSTATHADVIHVMEDGRIAESGTHSELLALNGRYAAGWNAQNLYRGPERA